MCVYWQNEDHGSTISGLREATLLLLLTDASQKSSLFWSYPKQYDCSLGHAMMPSQRGWVITADLVHKDRERLLRVTGQMMNVSITTSCCQWRWVVSLFFKKKHIFTLLVIIKIFHCMLSQYSFIWLQSPLHSTPRKEIMDRCFFP